ncbi:MAG: hypothetical protein ABI321_20675 [Polyangia bacterium]
MPRNDVPPHRRLRDRLGSHETDNPSLARGDATNLLLLIDDDLHETAQAMSVIDGFLSSALTLLSSTDVNPQKLIALCASDDVMECMDTLSETLVLLRRRMGALAATIR